MADTTTRVRDSEDFDLPSWSVTRVRKPGVKLAAWPRNDFTDGGWRIRRFLGEDENLYERRRKSLGDGESVERWFLVTSLTVERTAPEEKRAGRIALKEIRAEEARKRPSRAQRQEEKKHREDIMCRYALGVLFSDLIEEVDYAIIAGLFDDAGQRILRRIMRRMTDARILSYRLSEPEDSPKPSEPSGSPSPQLQQVWPKDVVH